MRHFLLDTQTLNEIHRREMNQTFLCAETAHAGQFRLRLNDDGSKREYVCHPLEVAFIFAKTEILNRKVEAHGHTLDQHVEGIVKIVARAAAMGKEELKRELLHMIAHLSREQLTIALGLILHDTIESAYRKDTPASEKITKGRARRHQIRKIQRNVQIVASRLTDSRKHKTPAEKHARQMLLALDKGYVALKQYDVLANMYDAAWMPNGERKLGKKMEILNHMRNFMKRGRKHIPEPMRLAAERIYQNSMLQIALSPA
jgi:hypothetical protein